MFRITLIKVCILWLQKNTHLNMYSFISVKVTQRGRGVDDWHNAHAVIHQSHVSDLHIHGTL